MKIETVKWHLPTPPSPVLIQGISTGSREISILKFRFRTINATCTYVATYNALAKTVITTNVIKISVSFTYSPRLV